MSAVTITALTVITGVVPAYLQCQTIADRIVSRPQEQLSQPIEIHVGRELLYVPWAEVLAAGDLIVEGIVQPVRTYVSDDGCTLLTDYSVSVTHVHRGGLPPSRKPGTTAPLTVTTVGGDKLVNGVPVSVRDEQLWPFAPGQRVLLILSRVDGASYRIARTIYGAFAVEDGRVKHLLRSAGAAKLPDVDRAAFVAKLVSQ